MFASLGKGLLVFKGGCLWVERQPQFFEGLAPPTRHIDESFAYLNMLCHIFNNCVTLSKSPLS